MDRKPISETELPGMALVGYIIFGGFVTGALGLIGAVFALFDGGNYTAMGLCLLAAAAAFGLTANALLRA
jgi:hypothetical protein